MLTIEIKDDIGDCNVVNQHFHATILVNRWGRNGVQETQALFQQNGRHSIVVGLAKGSASRRVRGHAIVQVSVFDIYAERRKNCELL
jgi:hypothetical protein